jgi:hypothetical protein
VQEHPEPSSETTPLLEESVTSVDGTFGLAQSWDAEPRKADESSSTITMAFDWGCLLASLLAQGIGLAIMGLNVKASAAMYVTGCFVTTLGAPTSSYISSLALELSPKSVAAGQLFGAFSLVDTFGRFTSPVLYTAVYSLTLGWYPPMMFLVAAATFMVAIAAAMSVRVPRSPQHT